jgi:predicted PhzF superfamily epimerase YddE/YHI9
MNRPGQVSVKIEVDQGNLVAAHIGGTAVIVSEGSLAL